MLLTNAHKKGGPKHRMAMQQLAVSDTMTSRFLVDGGSDRESTESDLTVIRNRHSHYSSLQRLAAHAMPYNTLISEHKYTESDCGLGVIAMDVPTT